MRVVHQATIMWSAASKFYFNIDDADIPEVK